METDTLKITVEHDGKKMTIETPNTGAWDDVANVFRTIGIWLTFAPDTVYQNIFRSDEPYPEEEDDNES